MCARCCCSTLRLLSGQHHAIRFVAVACLSLLGKSCQLEERLLSHFSTHLSLESSSQQHGVAFESWPVHLASVAFEYPSLGRLESVCGFLLLKGTQFAAA